MGRTRQPSKGVSGKIVDYLRDHQGKAVIDQTALAKHLGFIQNSVSYALYRLIAEGTVRALSPMGKGYKNVEFQLIKEVDFDKREGEVRQSPAKKDHADDKGSLDLKLSTSRELVNVYEELRKTQDLATKLQADKAKLSGRVGELEEELELEKRSNHHAITELSRLELQLRELRAESTRGARRLIFDQRGVQI